MSSIKVEELNTNHLYLLALNQSGLSTFKLIQMVLSGWVGKAEREIPLLQASQPFCLLASDKLKPIQLAIVQPENKRGSCWTIRFSSVLQENDSLKINIISKLLIQESLERVKNQCKSCLIKTQVNDTELIASAREMGFQPLKVYRTWNIPQRTVDRTGKKQVVSENCLWEDINKMNVQNLWRLEQASESVHLRQIYDRKSTDLLYARRPGTGCFFNLDGKNKTAIAALTYHEIAWQSNSYQLIRDIAWDERLDHIIKYIENSISGKDNKITLEVDNEDKKLNALLEDNLWVEQSEQLILGRTLWKRQSNNKLHQGSNSLNAVLKRLSPQNPPLPTPTSSQR